MFKEIKMLTKVVLITLAFLGALLYVLEIEWYILMALTNGWFTTFCVWTISVILVAILEAKMLFSWVRENFDRLYEEGWG